MTRRVSSPGEAAFVMLVIVASALLDQFEPWGLTDEQTTIKKTVEQLLSEFDHEDVVRQVVLL